MVLQRFVLVRFAGSSVGGGWVCGWGSSGAWLFCRRGGCRPIFDIERVVLTGSIIERQKDQDTAEWKYLVEGETIAGNSSVVVAKISVTGKLVIITVYLE